MGYQAQDWALKVEADLTPAERRLLIVLASFHHPKNGCFPSQLTILRRMRLTSRFHLSAMLARLERLQLISIRKNGRRNEYILQMDPALFSEGGLSNNRCGKPHIYRCGKPHLLKEKPHIIGAETRTYTESKSAANSLSPEGKMALEKTPNLKGNRRIRESVNSKAESDDSAVGPDPEIKHPISEGEGKRKFRGGAAGIVTDQTTPKTREEILQPIQTLVATGLTPNPKMVYGAWAGFCALYCPNNFTGGVTQKDYGQLKTAYQMAGPELLQTMEACIQHWPLYVREVKDSGAGYVKGYIEYPLIGFFLKNLIVAVNFSRKLARQETESVQPVAIRDPEPILTNELVTPENAHKPASLETALKVFGVK